MSRNTWPVVERKHEELIACLEMLLYESVAQTQLVLGCPRESLNIVSKKIDYLICFYLDWSYGSAGL